VDACTCVICLPGDATGLETAVAHVREHGWSVLRVGGRVEFAHTLGLWHTFRRPELVMFGLAGQDMQRWLNACVRYGREHGWPGEGVAFTGVIEMSQTQLRTVDTGWHPPLFGTAARYYQGGPVPFAQLVWPDAAGLWPWDRDASVGVRTRQALAWLPVAEHPPGGWRLVAELGAGFPFPCGPDQYVLTPRSMLHSGATVYQVVRHRRGYNVLDLRGYRADDLCLVFLGDLVRCHPELLELADLAPLTAAELGADRTWGRVMLTTTEQSAADRAWQALTA
jgi:hypothetical protein